MFIFVYNLKLNIMKSFTNLFGTKVDYRPFLQTSLNVYRVARFENNELDIVFENKSFKSLEKCKIACNEH